MINLIFDNFSILAKNFRRKLYIFFIFLSLTIFFESISIILLFHCVNIFFNPADININSNGGDATVAVSLSVTDEYLPGQPDEFSFNQSVSQAFYFVLSATDLYGEPLEANADWIGLFNGDVCVGAREWPGEAVDIPAMGYNEFADPKYSGVPYFVTDDEIIQEFHDLPMDSIYFHDKVDSEGTL